MDLDKTIALFMQGALDIDCKSMVLTQNETNGERYEGQGYIRQSETGVLIFKIYVSRYENANPYDQFNAMLNVTPGTLHPDHAFYDLHAIARDGTRWTAQRFIPKLHWDPSDATVLANGDLLTMSARVNSSEPNSYLRLHFFEKYDVPLNKMSAVAQHGTIQMVRDRADFEARCARWRRPAGSRCQR